MLGLADRVRIVDLFEALMKGDIAGALSELRAQYDIGADPAVVLNDLAEFTHFVTRVKVVPNVADDVSLSEAERVRGRAFASQLSMRVLSRCWQMLLKGVGEVQASGRPVAAAEMVLVRIAYAADLPTPDEVVKSLGDGGGSAPARAPSNGGGASSGATASQSFAPRYDAPRGSTQSSAATSLRPSDEPVAQLGHAEAAEPTLSLGSFEALIALAAEKRDITTKMALERDVRLVRFEDGQIEIALQPSAPRTLVHDLQRKLTAWTGKRWVVVVSREQGAPTMRDQAIDRQAEVRQEVMKDPLVLAVLQKFPGATVGQITEKGEDAVTDDAGGLEPAPEEED
jgi:DNA polymerase-3 subunit gamma/tau